MLDEILKIVYWNRHDFVWSDFDELHLIVFPMFASISIKKVRECYAVVA